MRVTAGLADGGTIDAAADLVHRLPVVRGGPGGGRLLFATCRHGDSLAGWVELPAG